MEWIQETFVSHNLSSQRFCYNTGRHMYILLISCISIHIYAIKKHTHLCLQTPALYPLAIFTCTLPRNTLRLTSHTIWGSKTFLQTLFRIFICLPYFLHTGLRLDQSPGHNILEGSVYMGAASCMGKNMLNGFCKGGWNRLVVMGRDIHVGIGSVEGKSAVCETSRRVWT